MTISAVDDGRWIRSYHQGGGVRLFCFPHAGGSASYFHRLSALLAPDVEVLAVQYPGRQDRRDEPCLESIGAMAAAVHGVLAGRLDRPYAFFGHSMGAVVAYETARLAHRSGLPGPERFVASGRRAPSRFLQGTVHLRDDDGVIEEIRSLGGTDERLLLDPDIRDMMIGPTRSDYKAVETYRCAPGFRLDCPVTVLIGDQDSHTTAEEAQAWEEHTTRGCDVRVFRGGHFFLDEQRSEVAAVLREAVAGLER